MLGLGLGVDKIRPSGGVDPAITALLSQAATDGYTAASGATLTALDTYVKGLKADGIWDKLDLLYVFATNGDSDFATYNLKDPANFQATKVNAPTFTSLEGFTGDGASAYLNTGWSPSDGNNYTLNSASYGIYMRSVGSPVFDDIAGSLSGNDIRLLKLNTVGNKINSGNASSLWGGTDILGLNHFIRVNSTKQDYYANGSFTNTANATTTSLSANSIIILGNSIGFTLAQISIFFAGADLSAEASDFYTHTQNYMTALGKEV